MFERRLKLLLVCIVLLMGVVLMRAAQVQIAQADQWRERAGASMTRVQTVETYRGAILDRHGKALAVDTACVDAGVDYRAIRNPPDAAWVQQVAVSRLAAKGLNREQRRSLLAREQEQVRADIAAMWVRLAEVAQRSDESREESIDRIEQTRVAIVNRVEYLKRSLQYHAYRRARERFDDDADRVDWKSWLLEGRSGPPEIDAFAVDIAEETSVHPVVKDLHLLVANQLQKDADRMPGLMVSPGVTRRYPYHESAAHVIGSLGKAGQEEVLDGGNDPRRRYLPDDLIGRQGIERLCEPILRGSRGLIRSRIGGDSGPESVEASPGKSIRLTIDIDLQKSVEKVFERVSFPWPESTSDPITTEMYGAAVVLDAQSGQVLAMASHPGYDLNELSTLYKSLSLNAADRPLLNRATQAAMEPGSTIKPVIGLLGVANGVVGLYEGIECTGSLIIDGKPQWDGKCWTLKQFMNNPLAKGLTDHHKLPTDAPHKGSHGNRDGFLMFADSLERSCNVFFETVASRMSMSALCDGLRSFGLGSETGIGIEEVPGLLPDAFEGRPALRFSQQYLAGMGQGYLTATPLQMASAVSVIANGGAWIRPTLLLAADDPAGASVADAGAAAGDVSSASMPSPTSAPTTLPFTPERRELSIPLAAINEARRGMVNVVHARAGTGKNLLIDSNLPPGLKLAGKTGSAQTSKLSIPRLDPRTSEQLRNEAGGLAWDRPKLITREEPWFPGALTWYRGSGGLDRVAHAWFVGFAPAENPQVAFCVWVEYGGSGGQSAAKVAQGVLEACVDHGYLPAR